MKIGFILVCICLLSSCSQLKYFHDEDEKPVQWDKLYNEEIEDERFNS